MYKNQLQELAQRSCFNLPSYTCVREGPDHAPRFKATVNFNGEIFMSPSFCTTLRQAEHSAAEVALNALATRGPSHSLAARVLDETGVYKNLLQEVSQRLGASLPKYMTFRSGLGHQPVFTCTVDLAGIRFTGEHAKNKKQAEKNAAMAAWSSMKLLAQQYGSSSSVKANSDEQEHVTVACAMENFLRQARMSNVPFPIKFPMQNPRPLSTQPPPFTASKILPLIRPKTAPRSRPVIAPVNSTPMRPKTAYQITPVTAIVDDRPICPRTTPESQSVIAAVTDIPLPTPESPKVRPQKFCAAGAAPYIPVRHFGANRGIAPPVTIRNAIPVFSAPPLPPPSQSPQLRPSPPPRIGPPVCVRQAVPVFATPTVCVKERALSTTSPNPPAGSSVQICSPNPPASSSVPISSPKPPASSSLQICSPNSPASSSLQICSPNPPASSSVPISSPNPPASSSLQICSPNQPASSSVQICSPNPQESTVHDEQQESVAIQLFEELKI